MKKVGETIYFGKRSGVVVSHATFKGIGHAEEVNTFYIVELNSESAAYLEADDDERDCFISVMLVNVENVLDEVTT